VLDGADKDQKGPWVEIATPGKAPGGNRKERRAPNGGLPLEIYYETQLNSQRDQTGVKIKGSKLTDHLAW